MDRLNKSRFASTNVVIKLTANLLASNHRNILLLGVYNCKPSRIFPPNYKYFFPNLYISLFLIMKNMQP